MACQVPIHVLVVEMTGVLRGIVWRILTRAGDLEVRAVNGGDDAIRRAVDEDEPDVLIAAIDAWTAGSVCEEVLFAHPHLRVLGLEGDGRRGSLYELQPRRIALGELSAEGLVAAIRERCPARRTRRPDGRGAADG